MDVRRLVQEVHLFATPILEVGRSLAFWWLSSSFGMQRLSLDILPCIRTQGAALILILLKDRPEQEQNIFRALVSKLVRNEVHHSRALS